MKLFFRYCGTDLALNANNCFGMKANLSGNTWKSVWNGADVYGKVTEEQDRSGNTYRVFAEFRKYPCVEDSIRDHSLYLLGTMNGSRLRYEGLTKAKDYRQAIQLIKNGGYATDVRYVDKICDIIRRYGLDRYDAETMVGGKGLDAVEQPATPEKQEEQKPVGVADHKKVAADAKQYVVQAGVFREKGNARRRLREVRKLGGAFKKAFMQKRGKNYVVQTGVFDFEQ